MKTPQITQTKMIKPKSQTQIQTPLHPVPQITSTTRADQEEPADTEDTVDRTLADMEVEVEKQ